ncbi:MAG: helix-turn-helix domain-containing protein [Treponema sp.]|jgi:SOS-response transcriptional repressor LexA|nr:helix-turn-helix domain-containing protein [Treponema sp.]
MKNFERLKIIRETIGANQSEFARTLGFASSFISGIERNKKDVSRELLQKLLQIYQVNINWLLSGEGEMFLGNPERSPKILEKLSLGAIIDQRLEKIEAQIAQIEGQLKKKSIDGPDSGSFVSEQEPKYGDEYVKIPFVDDIAAGPPIQQSEDLSGHINVPRRFIKTRPEDYYAARIRGESMTAAGIPDGCTVLIRRSDVPRDGAIQVVRSGGRATLKRMREGEDHTWTLHYEDGSNWSIPIGKDEDYQVQGDFVAVLPEKG